VLLQVLDDGRLTDGQGRTVDFRNAVIVLTSNIGTQDAAAIEEASKGTAAEKAELVRAAVLSQVRQSFRPELLNRLDEIVVFSRLGREDIAKIVDIQLDRVADRLKSRDIGIEVTGQARELLGELGWDPQYGARPLKRAIQRHLEDPLAAKVLAGEIGPGDVVYVSRSGGALELVRKVLN
jgi:ATP-dependent Clp protease ATP-binding subunit ClpB